MELDWGLGEYELTAPHLLPAAKTLVATAQLRPGERVLDVGTGTGNVALLAARAGAIVTAVEPSDRLRNFASAAAESEGLSITALPGEAAALPVPDASHDAVLSNFAVIFAPDPAAAMAEMLRVLAPEGRVVLTAWIPAGAWIEVNAITTRIVREISGAPQPPPAFAWHDRAALQDLVQQAGSSRRVTAVSSELTFRAASAQEYLERGRRHPRAVDARDILVGAGRDQEAEVAMLAVMEAGNEDPQAFRMTSRYVVLTIS